MARKKANTEQEATKVKLTVACVSLPHSLIVPDEDGYADVTAEELAVLKDLGVVADE